MSLFELFSKLQHLSLIFVFRILPPSLWQWLVLFCPPCIYISVCERNNSTNCGWICIWNSTNR